MKTYSQAEVDGMILATVRATQQVDARIAEEHGGSDAAKAIRAQSRSKAAKSRKN